MRRNGSTLWATASVLGVTACVGCVLREETITIARDGSAVIELEISGSPQELTQGDAMPSAQSGWDVRQRIEVDDDEEKMVLTTQRSFAPGEPLPATFASPNDSGADLYLTSPTELRVERRPDGVYYFFQRTYAPRTWANVQYWQDTAVDDDVRKLGAKPMEELTRDERRNLIQAFAAAAAFKQAEFTRAALAECAPDLPIESRLAARQALIDVYGNDGLLNRALHLDVTQSDDAPTYAMLERCDSPDEETRNACFDAEAARLFGAAHSALTSRLHNSLGFDAAQLARFEQSYDRAKRRHDITDQLGGQHFEITIEMPGTIVTHNAGKAEFDATKHTSAVQWEFDGKAFRDRTHELIVISRVVDGPDAKQGRPVDGDGR